MQRFKRFDPLSDLEGGFELDKENKSHPLHQSSFKQIFWDRGKRSGLLGFSFFKAVARLFYPPTAQFYKNILQLFTFVITMLVGAGGNAGNQAAVSVIRGLAIGTINKSNMFRYLKREALLAISLSLLLGLFGILRTHFSGQTTFVETTSLTVSLVVIVLISILIGASLPLLLQAINIDPANSSTTIQVIMDILGVVLTCSIASFILSDS